MSTFITRLTEGGAGPRLAVKDLIDVAGVPTTAGSRVVADRAQPAARDAACLAGARAADAAIVGKANLHELAFGTTGVNSHFGTPVNPLDARIVPGGSSSGSAVAVATGDADIAYGTDTGGSVRIPSACCGTVGLKTTHGRVSLDGVWPLSPSLDTVGPMARDVAGVVAGMQLLEPGFVAAADAPTMIGRVRLTGTDPAIDAAIDHVLAASECEIVEIELPGWDASRIAMGAIIVAEAWKCDGHLLDLETDHPIDHVVAERLRMGEGIPDERVDEARSMQRAWQQELDDVFARVQLLATPTLPIVPPAITAGTDATEMTIATSPVNVALIPALSVPVPMAGHLPASLQLIGPMRSEETLVAAGFLFEAVAAQLR